MSRYLLLLLFCLLPLFAQAADTRGLRVVAKDPATNQTAEVKLYNKSYAVVIGIDQYQNLPPDRQLNNAVHDAKGVADVLKRNFRFDKIVSLYNREATKDRILELLTEELPRSMGSEDSVFIFWAGHGNQEESAEGDIGYLIPYDGDTYKIRKNITMTEIRDTISKKIPAKHVLYVMDACYSGLLTTRSVDTSSRRDLAYIKSITKERVRQVLTAGSKGEEVLDGGPKGHSVFTGRLIEALEAAGDFITANEIQAILKEKVYGDARGRGKAQTPSFGALYGSGDYVFVPSSEWKLEQQRAEQRLRQKEIDKSLQEQAKLNREMAELAVLEQKAKQAANDRERRKLEDQQRIAQAKLTQERLRQQALEAEKQRQALEAEQLQRIEAERKRQLDEARQMEAKFRQDDLHRQQELQRLEQEQLKKKHTEEQKLTELRKQAEERRKQALAAASDALSIEAAVAEIRSANARIDQIKQEFSTELARRTAAAKSRLDEKLRLLKQSHDQRLASLQGQKVVVPTRPAAAPKDEFETPAEYKARLDKAEAEYQHRVTEARAGGSKVRQAEEEAYSQAVQQAEAGFRTEQEQLEQNAATEQQAAVKPFQERIATLSNKEYTLPPDSLLVELGQYDAEKQLFPVSIRNKPMVSQQIAVDKKTGKKTTVQKQQQPYVKVAMNGTIPLPRDAARSFKQQWQAGAVRPQVVAKAGTGKLQRVSMLNDGVTHDADGYLLEYMDGEFISVAERKRRERERELITGQLVAVPSGCFSVTGIQVCLDGFMIGKHEVTQGMWQKVMGSNPSNFKSCGDNCPVERVSWDDAQQFISKLNSMTGKYYRLPTEAEWEYACRAGGTEEYCGSNSVDAVAWYKDNSGGETHPVSQKQANAWGIHDMSGNVSEWCQDWAEETYPSVTKNPTGASFGSHRVVRGGSWDFGARGVRSAIRGGDGPGDRDDNLGFRLVLPSVQ